MSLDELIAELVGLRDNDPNRGDLPVYLDGNFVVSDVTVVVNYQNVELKVNII